MDKSNIDYRGTGTILDLMTTSRAESHLPFTSVLMVSVK